MRDTRVMFTDLPKVCQFCVEKLESVHKQFMELMKEMEKLEKVIQESRYGGKYGWRAEQFGKALRNSTLEGGSIEATLRCLGNLGKEVKVTSKIEAPSTSSKSKRRTAGPPIKKKNPSDAFNDPEQSLHCQELLDPFFESGPGQNTRNFEVDLEDQESASSSTPSNQRKRQQSSNFDKKIKRKKRKQGLQKLICDLCADLLVPHDMSAHVRDHVGEDYCIHCPNPTCPVVYSQPSSMSKHVNNIKPCKDTVPPQDLHKFPNKKSHTCEVCGFTTGNIMTLGAHLAEKHENDIKNLPCPITGCERKFSFRQSVVLHLPRHDFSRHVTTQICDLCSPTRIKCEDMEKHLKDVHGANEIINCSQCAFKFSSREHLIDHMHQHRYGTLTCDICEDGVSVTYSQHSNLRDHYFAVHQIGKKFECEECENVHFWKLEFLLEHQRRTHGGNPGQDISSEAQVAPEKKKTIYKCEECDDAVYKSLTSLKEHSIKFHGGDLFKCRFCGEGFPTSQTLKDHERKHKGLPAKTFPCQVEGCGRVLNSQHGLKKHYAVTHVAVRAHVCETCGKAFKVATSLRTHREGVHLNLRPFVCSECGESFSSGSVLKRHSLIHTGERPFRCDLCGQRFRHKEVLKKHLEGHQEKGADFKPNGPMKQLRKRVELKKSSLNT